MKVAVRLSLCSQERLPWYPEPGLKDNSETSGRPNDDRGRVVEILAEYFQTPQGLMLVERAWTTEPLSSSQVEPSQFWLQSYSIERHWNPTVQVLNGFFQWFLWRAQEPEGTGDRNQVNQGLKASHGSHITRRRKASKRRSSIRPSWPCATGTKPPRSRAKRSRRWKATEISWRKTSDELGTNRFSPSRNRDSCSHLYCRQFVDVDSWWFLMMIDIA